MGSAQWPVPSGHQSVENLLKQAYAAHRHKVKELETQLVELKNSKQTKRATCEQCQELQISLDRIREEYDEKLEEKDKIIIDLRTRLERFLSNDVETDELSLESEKPLNKRKKQIVWATDIATTVTLDVDAAVSPTPGSQWDGVLAPETAVYTQLGADLNEEEKTDLVVPETVPADIDDPWTDLKGNESQSMVSVEVDSKKRHISEGDDSPSSKARFSSPSRNIYFKVASKRYRRQKFKQTTLTQNVFSAASKTNGDVEKIHESSPVHVVKSDPDATDVVFESPVKQEPHCVDDSSLDETFVSSQYLRRDVMGGDKSPVRPPPPQCDATPSPDVLFRSKATILDGKDDKDTDDNATCSEDLLMRLETKKSSIAKTATKSGPSTSAPDSDDDFDIVPAVRKSPEFKYKRDTVRRQDERRRMDGHECRECQEYFSRLNLTEEEKRERLKFCSRHRDKHVAPGTPEHFWSIRFPTTQECNERGVLESTQYKPLQSRRQRQLN